MSLQITPMPGLQIHPHAYGRGKSGPSQLQVATVHLKWDKVEDQPSSPIRINFDYPFADDHYVVLGRYMAGTVSYLEGSPAVIVPESVHTSNPNVDIIEFDGAFVLEDASDIGDPFNPIFVAGDLTISIVVLHI